MKRITSFCISLLLWQMASAQSDMSLYNFNAVAQSLHTNPAMPQQTKLWIGLPAISGLSASYHNSAFSLVDLAATGTDVNANIQSIILNLDERSHLSSYNTIDLLGVGFKTKNGFVVMGAQQIIDLKVDFNPDLFQLLWFGNGSVQGRHANISDFDAEYTQHTSYYAGYQHTFLDEKLRIGVRGKFLIGQQHMFVDRMNIDIRTSDSSTIHASSDIRVRTAGLGGAIDNDNSDIFGSLVFPKNRGYAMDFGVFYQPNSRWNFSASLLDFGYVKWSSNTRDYTAAGSFDYHGLQADFKDNPPVQSQDQVIDSLKAAFGSQETDGNVYSRRLSSRVFAAADYNFSEKHSVGSIYHMRLWEGQAYHDFSVNYRARVARWFQFIANYSIINGTYANIGGGFDLKAGPVQLYVLSDNILGSIMYENLQSTSVRVGLNIALYGKKDKKPAATAPIPEQEPESGKI